MGETARKVLSHNAFWTPIGVVIGTAISLVLSHQASKELRSEAQKLREETVAVRKLVVALESEAKYAAAETSKVSKQSELLLAETASVRGQGKSLLRETAKVQQQELALLGKMERVYSRVVLLARSLENGPPYKFVKDEKGEPTDLGEIHLSGSFTGGASMAAEITLGAPLPPPAPLGRPAVGAPTVANGGPKK